MSAELVPVARKFRKQIPESHRANLDTRIHWLWHQRFGTVQMVWHSSKDVLDHTAATLVIQCIFGGGDLDSIIQLFQRIEGGAISAEAQLEKDAEQIRV